MSVKYIALLPSTGHAMFTPHDLNYSDIKQPPYDCMLFAAVEHCCTYCLHLTKPPHLLRFKQTIYSFLQSYCGKILPNLCISVYKLCSLLVYADTPACDSLTNCDNQTSALNNVRGYLRHICSAKDYSA